MKKEIKKFSKNIHRSSKTFCLVGTQVTVLQNVKTTYKTLHRPGQPSALINFLHIDPSIFINSTILSSLIQNVPGGNKGDASPYLSLCSALATKWRQRHLRSCLSVCTALAPKGLFTHPPPPQMCLNHVRFIMYANICSSL